MKSIKFKYWSCKVVYGFYGDGSRAIQLIDSDTDEPIAKATVWVAGYEPPTRNHVLIKNYSENKGMLDALINAGIVRPTGRIFPIGFGHAHEVEILSKEPVFKSGRGGSRKNAGRKKGSVKPDSKKKLSIRLRPLQIAWLRNQKAGISPTIERLIIEEMAR